MAQKLGKLASMRSGLLILICLCGCHPPGNTDPIPVISLKNPDQGIFPGVKPVSGPSERVIHPPKNFRTVRFVETDYLFHTADPASFYQQMVKELEANGFKHFLMKLPPNVIREPDKESEVYYKRTPNGLPNIDLMFPKVDIKGRGPTANGFRVGVSVVWQYK